MSRYWYALKSHPHKEDLLLRQAEARNFEVFYPRIRVHPVNPRSHTIRPYFPGYLFIHIDIEESGTSVFQWMPYSSGLVSFGGDPAAVPDSFITAIRQRVHEIFEAGGELLEGLKPGDKVLIQGGPFEGYEAVFDIGIPGNERVRVLLKLLNDQAVRLELPVGQIGKPRKSTRPKSGG